MRIHQFLACLVIAPAILLLTAAAPDDQIPASIPLWAAGAPGSEGHTAPEIVAVRGATPDDFRAVSSINNPSITPFLPDPAIATGAAVIIAPGGGHQFLAIDHEGYNVARALAQRGIAGFVLKYRLAKEKNSPYKVEVHALMDAQRAIRLIRGRAADWNLNPHHVGIIGFSAGGEISMLAATRFDKPVPGSSDDIDKLDCRPDFYALLYPGGLTDPDKIPVTKDTPPAFLACAYNDRITISRNLAQFYLDLKAAGVPAELHIYNSGGHGFGIRATDKRPVSGWINLFTSWMGDRGLLNRSAN